MSLDRFVEAQQDHYERALRELRSGRKASHWMWFVFPQIEGLGHSPMAQRYAIRSLAEARSYAAHPVLGPRLRECTRALLALPPTTTASEVFGGIDAMKLRSSLTLFLRAAPEHPEFAQALDRYHDGRPDDATDSRLRGSVA